MELAAIKVSGMTCQGCVGSVTRVLQAIPGVENVEVSLEAGEARLRYDPARTEVPALCRAVEDAGYQATQCLPVTVPAPEVYENWTLIDGSSATLRPIRGSDMELERAFVRNLSPLSKFKRFMGELKELSPEQLHKFTHLDHYREAAYVVIRSTVAGEEEIGVGRFVIGAGGEICEFAVTVADAWQSKGVGGRLMRALLQEARARGLKRMEGLVLASNRRMLDFARKLGFTVHLNEQDSSVRVVRREL